MKMAWNTSLPLPGECHNHKPSLSIPSTTTITSSLQQPFPRTVEELSTHLSNPFGYKSKRRVEAVNPSLIKALNQDKELDVSETMCQTCPLPSAFSTVWPNHPLSEHGENSMPVCLILPMHFIGNLVAQLRFVTSSLETGHLSPFVNLAPSSCFYFHDLDQP